MITILGSIITFLMEMADTAYRAFLIWMLYGILATYWPNIPEQLPYTTVFIVVLMIRIIFIDFTDVVVLIPEEERDN